VNVSGAISNSRLVAGGSIGAVSAGSMSDSLVLAGARLGADRALGGIGGDSDSFQRAASIAAITVKGAFARSSLVAGIDPGNAIFGDGDDAAAAAAGTLPNAGVIGAIKLSAGALATASGTQSFAIEASKIASLKVGAVNVTNFSTPHLLDLGPVGLDADDLLVRLVP
jgi:hypothetical protein